MPSGATTATASNFIKRYYSPKMTVNTVSKVESRTLNLITHDTGGSGDDYNFLTMYGDNPSGSQDFLEAQTTGQNAMSGGAQFKVTWCNDFQVPSVGKDIIAKTKNKAGGWIPQLKNEMDSSLRYSAHRRSVALFTTGFGELATMTNAPAANGNVTLGNPRTGTADRSVAYRFVKGMTLVFSATISANALRAGQSAKILKVDYTAGTLVLDTNTNAITGLAQNDVIFTKGDRQDSATPSRLRPAGLPAWIPTTAPSAAENFFGQDRTTNSFLYGWIIDGTATGKSIMGALVEAANYCSTVGHAEKLVAVLSVDKFIEISAGLDNKQYTQITGRGGVGYKTIVVYADGVELPVISEQYCTNSEGYVIAPSPATKHPSIGDAPHIDSEDGNQILRQSAAAGVEVRYEAFECFSVENCAACAVVKFA
jgi:hypothetical protein